MPYDQFVTEQLAGDEIEGSNESSVIATGMLRAGTWNDEPNDAQDYKYERLEDMVDVVSTAFLGMTVRCARCHDHKFDPIPTKDYYALAGIFHSTKLSDQPIQTVETQQALHEHQQQMEHLNQERDRLQLQLDKRLSEYPN